MNYLENYKKWLESDAVDAATKEELLKIKDDENELIMRFSDIMPFGTAGQRGVMGAGLNRLNLYTVRYTTKALANLIIKEGKEAMKKGVVIAFDCRINSKEFGFAAAEILASNGINVMIFNEITPTPVLSYPIRKTGAIAGINITASHNPPEYNGYKVYWSNGAQMPPDHAAEVANELKVLDIFEDCKIEKTEKSGKIKILNTKYEKLFCKEVLKRSINHKAAKETSLEVYYSPLHGTGLRAVPAVLKKIGVKVNCVDEQMVPDGYFTTVSSPNPENVSAFELSVKKAEKKGSKADLLVATDPDADRIGVMVKHNGEYVALNGNQTGVLLLYYIISAKKEKGMLPKNAGAVSTIVSTPLAEQIAIKNGVKFASTFTGFKFIAEQIDEWLGKTKFIFGFEESFGYMVGDYARDKDSIGAAMMVCEAAAYYKKSGKTLIDVLNGIYEEYGYYGETTDNIMMKGIDGAEKTKKLMETLRGDITEIGGEKIVKIADYKTGEIKDVKTGKTEPTGMESSDVLKFFTKNGSAICVRPSGTEPKVKVYYLIKGKDEKTCKKLIEKMKKDIDSLVK